MIFCQLAGMMMQGWGWVGEGGWVWVWVWVGGCGWVWVWVWVGGVMVRVGRWVGEGECEGEHLLHPHPNINLSNP
jgi:hypothetical protein